MSSNQHFIKDVIHEIEWKKTARVTFKMLSYETGISGVVGVHLKCMDAIILNVFLPCSALVISVAAFDWGLSCT